MDALKRKQLVRLARKARKAAELLAKKDGLPRKLHGMCARASAILFELLHEAGFKPHICFAIGHCFLEVEDLVVDITASQFGYSKIFIVPIKDLYSNLNLNDQLAADTLSGWWDKEPDYVYDSIEQAIAHQDKQSWPHEQLISREDFI